MKKSDIDTHGERGRVYPAINVKVHRMPWTDETIAEHFKCSADVAQQAARFSFEAAQEQFWEDAKEQAAEIFGAGVKVYSGGRSGGWLEVDGLSDVESWDAIAVSAWARFNAWARQAIEYLTSWDYHREAIEANRWAEEGAEEYNFYHDKAGATHCISEEKAKAIAAGFGPVVRK